MVTIGISTYNRKSTLIRMAHSFHATFLPVACNVRIYDDASTEYDIDFLKSLFPEAVSIIRHDKNIGASENMYYMYNDFLNTEDMFFFNADSDLIFQKNWLEVLLKTVKMSDGVLSAFNTVRHENIDGYIAVEGYKLIEKKDLGAAGVFFTRDCMKTLIKSLKDGAMDGFDWRWSKAIRDSGKRLWALENSVVQHIGILGYNSDNLRFDYGQGFRVDSLVNGQIFNEVLEDISLQPKSLSTKFYLFPFSEVERGSNIIIYGRGLVGTNYIKQIELTGYCNIVAIVDEKFRTMEGVVDPASIPKYNYKAIVVASANGVVAEEIESRLINMGIDASCIIGSARNRLIRI